MWNSHFFVLGDLYLITFVDVLLLIIRNHSARIIRTDTARLNLVFTTAFPERTAPCRLKDTLRPAATAADFLWRKLPAEFFFIEPP